MTRRTDATRRAASLAGEDVELMRDGVLKLAQTPAAPANPVLSDAEAQRVLEAIGQMEVTGWKWCEPCNYAFKSEAPLRSSNCPHCRGVVQWIEPPADWRKLEVPPSWSS